MILSNLMKNFLNSTVTSQLLIFPTAFSNYMFPIEKYPWQGIRIVGKNENLKSFKLESQFNFPTSIDLSNFIEVFQV